MGNVKTKWLRRRRPAQTANQRTVKNTVCGRLDSVSKIEFNGL
jgi:hypothetical protein